VWHLALYAIVCGIVVSAVAEWWKRRRVRARELPNLHYQSLAEVKAEVSYWKGSRRVCHDGMSAFFDRSGAYACQKRTSFTSLTLTIVLIH
jgi:hypothetical protein